MMCNPGEASLGPMQRSCSQVNWSIAATAQISKTNRSSWHRAHKWISKPDWGMWNWHPMWPPSTSLSLENWDFSFRKFIDIHTLNSRHGKKTSRSCKNAASQRLENGHLEKYPETDFSGRDAIRCDRDLINAWSSNYSINFPASIWCTRVPSQPHLARTHSIWRFC